MARKVSVTYCFSDPLAAKWIEIEPLSRPRQAVHFPPSSESSPPRLWLIRETACFSMAERVQGLTDRLENASSSWLAGSFRSRSFCIIFSSITNRGKISGDYGMSVRKFLQSVLRTNCKQGCIFSIHALFSIDFRGQHSVSTVLLRIQAELSTLLT